MTDAYRVIVSIHGIRTFGQWQQRLALMVKAGDPTVRVESYYYGYFSVIAFLIPFFRWLIVRRFRAQFEALVRDHPAADFVIVAHSFGTHIASWALAGIPPDRLPAISRLIPAGSVLRSDFDFTPLLRSGRLRQVVNDCGTDDNVLLHSQLLILFTGMAGRVGLYGFTDDRILNRFHPGGHSLYFVTGPSGTSPFMETWWKPLFFWTGHRQRGRLAQVAAFCRELVIRSCRSPTRSSSAFMVVSSSLLVLAISRRTRSQPTRPKEAPMNPPKIFLRPMSVSPKPRAFSASLPMSRHSQTMAALHRRASSCVFPCGGCGLWLRCSRRCLI